MPSPCFLESRQQVDVYILLQSDLRIFYGLYGLYVYDRTRIMYLRFLKNDIYDILLQWDLQSSSLFFMSPLARSML